VELLTYAYESERLVERYGIERAGIYWIAWRLIIGRKVYYQRQIGDSKFREPIYFGSKIDAQNYLADEIDKDKDRVIWSA
jgi:hypothetical protein